MLISFSVENWKSFRDEATFSMVATNEEKHKNHLFRINDEVSLLPIAAIYGANASGKTKWFEAIRFARHFIKRVAQLDSAIPRESFKLDRSYLDKPSRFVFQILIKKICYEYSFAVTEKAVIEESLKEISNTNEKFLYERRKEKISFLFDNLKIEEKERSRLELLAIQSNQLFLTNSVTQKIKYFKPVYDWFNESLILISPETMFGDLYSAFIEGSSFNKVLAELDVGIKKIISTDIPIDGLISNSFKTTLIEKLEEGDEVRGPAGGILLKKESGELKAKKLISYHFASAKKGANEVAFDLEEESAGTLRVMNLLPAFALIAQSNSEKVVLIDELNHSLHSLLTLALLRAYLSSRTPRQKSQLIFTTHDTQLLDLDLFRPDEIWVAEKDVSGNSSLIAFGEYQDINEDPDIRKSYLEGRLGGVPRIFLSNLNQSTKKKKTK